MSNTKGNEYLFRKNITIINLKKKKKNIWYNLQSEGFRESLLKFMGQTITIYTVSGGISGQGFTGVLLKITNDHIKLLTKPESPPVISFECNNLEEDNLSLGTITNIPLNKIAAFIHNIV